MPRRLLAKALPKLWSNYGPVILSQRSETSFGSHPCRVVSVSYEQNGCCHGRRRIDFQIRLHLDPFMIHEAFPTVTETAFGSHPCRVVSVTYRKRRPFHGGNTGSNPVGDTKSNQRFTRKLDLHRDTGAACHGQRKNPATRRTRRLAQRSRWW